MFYQFGVPMNISKYQENQEHLVISIIKSKSYIIELLSIVKNLDLNEWCIAAGTIRGAVWDHLHGFNAPTLPTDIDVLFYDRDLNDSDHEIGLQKKLAEIKSDVQWEVVNQATIHEHNKDRPYSSISDALSRWVEPANAIGAYLDNNNEIRLIAPFGVEDLLSMTVRPNLKSPTAKGVYIDRMKNKKWQEKWPKIKIIMPKE